tara:strand:+ start:543 stop:785 length:243 start_codon:yes stop_codon:yes gene_type:complete
MINKLNKEQRSHIIREIERNKLLGYENPYEIATNIKLKVMELNEFETYYQEVESFLDDCKWVDNEDNDMWLIEDGEILNK